MGHSSQDPHLCWTTSLLGVISLLCACSTLAKSSGAHGSGIKGFRSCTYLKAIRGGSVLLQEIQEPEDPKIEEISWGTGSDSNSTFMLRLQNGKEDPLWFGLQDKYKQRIQVPSMSSLRTNKLTSQDSGQYWAQIMFQTGREIKAVFHLTVYGIDEQHLEERGLALGVYSEVLNRGQAMKMFIEGSSRSRHLGETVL